MAAVQASFGIVEPCVLPRNARGFFITLRHNQSSTKVCLE